MRGQPSYEELFRENEKLSRKIKELELKVHNYQKGGQDFQIWESESFMQAILNNIQDGISVLNPDLTIRYVNPVMEKWYAKNMPLVGKKCFTCYHNKKEACDPCPTIRAMESGKTEFDVVPALNDPESWIELYSYPLKDLKSGELKGVVEFVRDISERVQAEKLLFESRERYQTIFDDSPIPLWEEDFTELFIYLDKLKKDGIDNFRSYFEENRDELFSCVHKIKYRDVNNATIELFEAGNKQYFFNNLESVITEDSYNVFYEEIINLAQGKKKFSSEVKIRTLKGNTRYLDLNLIIDDSKEDFIRALVVTPEITDRKLIEQKLRESESRFRLAFQTNPDAISLTSLNQGRYIDVNSGFTQITGYAAEEIIGKTSVEINIWCDYEARRKLLETIQANGYVINYEAQFRMKQGEIFTGLMSAAIMKINEEDVLLSITKNITDLKNIQSDLVKSKQSLQLALEGGGLGMWDWNIHTNKVIFSQLVADMLGYELSELEPVFDFWKSLIHPDDVDGVMKSLQLHLDGMTEHYEHEYRVVARDGNWKWISDRGKVLEWDDKDRPLRALGTHLDITERKLSEEKTAKLHKAVEKSPVSIVITDKTGSIEYVNPEFSRLTGYSFEEAIGKKTNILQSGWHSDEFYHNLWSTINRGDVWFGEFLNRKKDNTTYWEKANISSIKNENGEITHFVAVKEDVTEMKLMVEDLQRAKEKAEESDRLKSAFLANMSHEIRTPMNGILGFTNLLKETLLTEEKKLEYLNIIEKSGARMLNLINDLIDISRIEAGETEVFNSSTILNELLEEVYNFFKPEADKKGIELGLNNTLYEKMINFSIDREKLFAVLSNLVKNAVKYSDRGEIELGCRLYKRRLLFYVKDTGIGIPEEKQKLIFNRFIQADENIKKAYEGSGLGLAISKAYVEMMGGEIWLDSEPGKGSIFYFTIPYAPLNQKPISENLLNETTSMVESRLKNVSILIADDDQNSKIYLNDILSDICNKVFQVSDGSAAVKIIRENPDIDIVLMDVKMPVMDGYEACRKIRKFNSDIIIVAQTAYAVSGEEEKAKSAGCNDFLTKPINKKQLFQTLERFI